MASTCVTKINNLVSLSVHRFIAYQKGQSFVFTISISNDTYFLHFTFKNNEFTTLNKIISLTDLNIL